MANEITHIVGDLTSDPELRYTPSGAAAVVKFTVASTRASSTWPVENWQGGEPVFMSCTSWRDLAENAVPVVR
uniref:Single-strand DNA-binding protein n=1 Tax=uncultured bacterium esnapd14 TaxID=1366594 RepID=S5TUS2_9BACT|nr:single-strand DNA-binding protein [uncultured bacterium esnapd14]